MYFLFFSFFLLAAPCVCRILLPRPGIKPMLFAVEAWNLNHWTTREVFTVFHNQHLLQSSRRLHDVVNTIPILQMRKLRAKRLVTCPRGCLLTSRRHSQECQHSTCHLDSERRCVWGGQRVRTAGAALMVSRKDEGEDWSSVTGWWTSHPTFGPIPVPLFLTHQTTGPETD